MNIAQPLRKLMDERKLSNSKLAREVGVHTSTVSNWLDGKEVKAENLTALCTYFGCSLDYLAGKMEETKKAPDLTEKDRRDVAKLVENIMNDMEQAGDLNFDGMPMSEEARAAMASAMKIGLEEARRRNKETYTPKKYRKG